MRNCFEAGKLEDCCISMRRWWLDQDYGKDTMDEDVSRCFFLETEELGLGNGLDMRGNRE